RSRVDTAALRGLGASGSVNVGTSGMQVVVGPIADQLAGESRASLRGRSLDAAQWLRALGGRDNVQRVESASGRVLLTVKDNTRVNADELVRLGARGVGKPSATSVHVLHADADALEAALEAG